MIYNATEIREFHMVINSEDLSIKKLRLQGLQCISGTCPQDTVDPVDPEAEPTLWSDITTWASGALPVAGEDVIIASDMFVILDIETPVLNLVTVNGKLSFQDQTNGDLVHLKAKQVYVRAGELLIGEEGTPYMGEAQISLFGLRSEATEIMSGSVATGNKLIFNTGTVSLHGKTRSRHSRMQVSVIAGDTSATVAPGLDWVTGDELYFAPTNHQWTHSEYRTIATYDDTTGIVTLTAPFDFYHFGEAVSTAAEYNGVDTRGEVRLLTRNVKVVGHDDGDNWGGSILTTDRTEFDGTERQGTTQFDFVEVAGCSQENTFNAAIRFESTGNTGLNWIKNSVVHDSQAWSLYITGSKDILVESSDFIGAKAVGVNLNSVTGTHLDDIFVADVSKRVWTGGDNTIDKEACVAFCSYFEPNSCFDSSVTNSIAAGCAFAGFVAPGHACDNPTSMPFQFNVAHSGERVGAHIYPDPADSSSATCYQGSNFAAYKNRDGGLQTMYTTLDVRMHDMTFIDNEKGVCLQTGGERELIKISMTDVEIYGEDNNSDVPAG